MARKKAETAENTEKVDNEILDTYQPADCFDKVKTRGRPKLKLNATGVRVIEALAAVQCTEEEIAACLHCTVETLHSSTNEETFLECYKKGSEQGKMSLRRKKKHEINDRDAFEAPKKNYRIHQRDRETIKKYQK